MKTQLHPWKIFWLSNQGMSNSDNQKGSHPHLILEIGEDDLLILPLSTKPMSKYYQWGTEQEPSWKIGQNDNYFCLNHIKWMSKKQFFQQLMTINGTPSEKKMSKMEKTFCKTQFKKLMSMQMKDSFLQKKQSWLKDQLSG